MKSPLVSIIVPAYNSLKYIDRFLQSVLSQDYDNIELIIVNDGSTDGTLDRILSYTEQFSQKGYSLICRSQENLGQAAALNVGLQIFKGKYLMWVDSDDILYPKNVSEKVSFLENNPDFGMVLCQGEIVSEKDIEKKIADYKRKKPTGTDDLFVDYLLENNVVFSPGVAMVTQNAFCESIPSGQIYESREGQNWQLYLPISYNYKCGYIEKVLFKVVAHDDSHSRAKRSAQQQIDRIAGFIDLLTHVLIDMNLPSYERDKYLKIVKEKYCHRYLRTISHFSANDSGEHYLKALESFSWLQKNRKIKAGDVKCFCLIAIKSFGKRKDSCENHL